MEQLARLRESLWIEILIQGSGNKDQELRESNNSSNKVDYRKMVNLM